MSRADYLDMIQRNLDGDLSPVEQADLERKLATDPELQLIHSRLSHVSSRLEQLPQVTPRFSIVDSILPQLDSSSPDPVQPQAQPQIRELPRLEKKMGGRELEEKPRRIPSWLLKASSGVVAASLLFGLYAMAHPTKPALEPDQTNGSSSTPTDSVSTTTNPTPAKEQVAENKTPTDRDHSNDPGKSADPSSGTQQSVNQAQDPAVTTSENEGKSGSRLNLSPYLSPSKHATATYNEKDKKQKEERDKEKEKDKEKNESIINKEKKKTAASSKASPARDAESDSKATSKSESEKKEKEKGYEKDKNQKQKSNDD